MNGTKRPKDAIDAAIDATGVPVINRIEVVNIETMLPTGAKVTISGIPTTFSPFDLAHLVEVLVSLRQNLAQRQAEQRGGLIIPGGPQN